MGKKVIILEDNEEIREMIEYILIHEDFDVITYGTAAKFWEGIDKTDADLFLLDIMLPDANGIEICKELKLRKQTEHVPVVIMSAHYNGLGSECAADDFIRKPFDVDDLVFRIQQQVAN